MRTSTKLIRLCAVVPAGLAGSFVAIISLGFLPSAGLVFAFLGTLLVALVLASGRWEATAARILALARGLRPGEHAVMEPTLRLSEKIGLAPGRVLVRLSETEGPLATPIGRDTVVVQPWLVQALYQRHLTVAEATTLIAHAVARQRIGPTRFDLAARLWALPWTLLVVLIRRVAEGFSWVPAGRLAWQLRIVVGIVALVQGLQPGGDRAVGIGAAALVALSYIGPAADRAWRSVVERDADRMVARAGLAQPLIGLVHGSPGTRSLERVHRIQKAASETDALLHQVEPAQTSTMASTGSRQLLPRVTAQHH